MNIGIICAMPEEAQNIIEALKLTKSEDKKFSVYQGKFQEKNISLIISNIGKIYASMGTQWLITNYKSDIIINTGLAGGLKKEFAIGKVFIANEVKQHDVYLPWNGEHLDYLIKPIQIPSLINTQTPSACVLTGDQFVDKHEDHERLKKEGDVVEMEAFAVASVCKVFQTPYIILKSISDNAEDDAKADFDTNIQIAMKNSLPVFLKVLETL